MRKIIAIIGETTSGKTTLSQYVHTNYNYRVYEIGDYVRKEYKRIRANMTLMEFSNLYYTTGKITHFIELAIKDSQNCKQNMLFGGIRTIEEFKCLRKAYPNVTVILIKCDTDNRKKRYYKSHLDNVSIEERNRIETIWMKELLNTITPDYVIYNDNTLEDFYMEIQKLFTNVIE